MADDLNFDDVSTGQVAELLGPRQRVVHPRIDLSPPVTLGTIFGANETASE